MEEGVREKLLARQIEAMERELALVSEWYPPRGTPAYEERAKKQAENEKLWAEVNAAAIGSNVRMAAAIERLCEILEARGVH